MNSLPLTQNEYGFDVGTDNPFVVFRYLNQIATASVGAGAVLDLSRGDPGYGMAPNIRGRRLLSYLVFLDTVLNTANVHFKDTDESDVVSIKKTILDATHAVYAPEKAAVLLADLEEFVLKARAAAERVGTPLSEYQVYFHTFKYATVSGGCYHDPYGELLARIVVSDFRNTHLGLSTKPADYIFTSGASHAIGTFFKAFGTIGTEYLKKGDTVLITSPVYFPYMGMMEARGLTVETISVSPTTGQFTEESFAAVRDINPKVIVLVDPDNPSGFRKNAESLKRLAEYAEAKDALILSDEVYHFFFEEKDTIARFAPKRTIRIDALSKIERMTGCRFGEFMVSEEANAYLTAKLSAFLPKGTDIRTYLHDAKSPDGVKGFFKHTTFVPGMAQFLGIAQMLLGAEERAAYAAFVKENMELWYAGLGLPYPGNLYYSLFDMNAIASETKRNLRAEKKLLDLAKLGVVLIPANRFFSAEDRTKQDCTNFVRASLPNVTTEQAKQASRIIREYLAA